MIRNAEKKYLKIKDYLIINILINQFKKLLKIGQLQLMKMKKQKNIIYNKNRKRRKKFYPEHISLMVLKYLKKMTKIHVNKIKKYSNNILGKIY